MLDGSIATPSLVAAVIHSKYTNAVPLYRQEQEYARNDMNISRQTMANWVIKTSERYFSLVYDRMREELMKSPVIHADETPAMVDAACTRITCGCTEVVRCVKPNRLCSMNIRKRERLMHRMDSLKALKESLSVMDTKYTIHLKTVMIRISVLQDAGHMREDHLLR